MNVKIQGGGNGTYANTGSCVAVTNYLQHEDLERMKKGEEVQPFFNQFRDYVSAREVTFKIDNNKAKLSRTDAKFYVITVSPSEKELRCMGGTPQERAEALRRYIRIGTAALFVCDGWFTEQRENVQDLLSAKGRNKIKFDDYMQYSPMVAVYGLNLAGVKGKHSFKGRTIILAMSYATMGMIVNTMKYSFKEKRPDSNTRNSFPSGHTATAFMGAEFLYREYRDVSPWIGYAGYAIAAITGYLRIYNDRHYLNDVVAGACIGVLSTKLAYWLYPKIFKKSECYKEHVAIVTLPYYSAKEVGLNMCICF